MTTFWSTLCFFFVYTESCHILLSKSGQYLDKDHCSQQHQIKYSHTLIIKSYYQFGHLAKLGSLLPAVGRVGENPGNEVAIRPTFFGPLVTILTGFHCMGNIGTLEALYLLNTESPHDQCLHR